MRWTPLHYAVMGGHEEIVGRLLDKAPVRRITINRKDVRDVACSPGPLQPSLALTQPVPRRKTARRH